MYKSRKHCIRKSINGNRMNYKRCTHIVNGVNKIKKNQKFQ